MSFLIEKLLVLSVVMVSLTIHEFCHGLVAFSLGDKTAKLQGRLSLNPIKHVDPVGLLLLMVASFGWAKPVPVDPRNFTKTDIHTGMLLTAVAGPMSNILLVFLGVMTVSSMSGAFLQTHELVWTFLSFFIVINANLAFFNLLPVPPLDGSKILFGILPKRYYNILYIMDRYGGFLLMLLIVTGGTRYIIQPLSQGIISAFFDLAGIIFN